MKEEKIKKYEGKLLWDGKKYVTATTYSACERETLFRTQSGRWMLYTVYTDRSRAGDWKELNKLDAAKWLVINGYDPHPDVAQEYVSLRIDSAYYKYHPQYQRKTLKARQRTALTDGTGRWFDLAIAVRTNLFSKPDIVWNEDKTAYVYQERYTFEGQIIVHTWIDHEASHRWFLEREI